MDFLPDISTLSMWLTQYGSFALFVLLTFGIVAFPIPEETLMVVAGVLVLNGHLNMLTTILAALAGSMCGITISYIIGKTAGHYLIGKYGKWLGIKEYHLKRVDTWFTKYGKWTLFFGYFIPGIRHFTGLSAGLTNLSLRNFALFAYSGAAIWVTVFLSIGYFFGHYWHTLFNNIEIGTDDLVLLITFIYFVGLFYFFKKRNNQTIY